MEKAECIKDAAEPNCCTNPLQCVSVDAVTKKGHCCPATKFWNTTPSPAMCTTCLRNWDGTTGTGACGTTENPLCGPNAAKTDYICGPCPDGEMWDTTQKECIKACPPQVGIVFVVDRSGSMKTSFPNGEMRTKVVDDALKKISVNVNAYTAVFEHDASATMTRKLAWGKHTINQIKTALFNYKISGNTGFMDAFTDTLNLCRNGEQKFIILWLTDGSVNSKKTNLKNLLKGRDCESTFYIVSNKEADKSTYGADQWINVTNFNENSLSGFANAIKNDSCYGEKPDWKSLDADITYKEVGGQRVNAYLAECDGYRDSSGLCYACPANAACSASGFTCNTGYYKDDNVCTQCKANVASCTGKTTGIVCKAGYYKSFNECVACPANATCSGNNITCNTGYYKSNNQCVACTANAISCTSSSNFTCKAGYYKKNSQCVACPDNATCSNNTICCNANYYKSNNTCKACSNGKTTKGLTCRTASSACKS